MNDTAKLLAQRVENKIMEDREPDTPIELDDVFNAAFDVIKKFIDNDYEVTYD